MNKTKRLILSGIAAAALAVSVHTAFAETPIYDENGNIEGYWYSEDDFDMDKLRQHFNGELQGSKPVEVSAYIGDIDGADVYVEGATHYATAEGTYLSVSEFSVQLDYESSWDGETQTATFVKPGNTVILKIGEKTALKNGETVDLRLETRIYNDRTCVEQEDIRKLLSINYTEEQ